MSLTSDIKAKGEFYQQLVTAVNLDAVQSIIDDLNSNLSTKQRLVVDFCQDYPWPTVGMAVIYAFFQEVKPGSWVDTVGGRCMEANERGLLKYYIDLYSQGTEYDKVKCALVMAKVDSMARSPHILRPPTKGIKGLLAESKIPQAAIEDTAQLIASIPNTITFMGLREAIGLTINPSFQYSWIVGGADAQAIVSIDSNDLTIPQNVTSSRKNFLLDIKTSAKSRPVTEDQILQQLGYYFLDADNHLIDGLMLYFPRHQSWGVYSISQFLNTSPEAAAEAMYEWFLEAKDDYEEDDDYQPYLPSSVGWR
jgi:hypothetical protein